MINNSQVNGAARLLPISPGQRLRPAPIGVLHLIDSLELGGAETVAVSLVNRLNSDRWRASVCTTRSPGPGLIGVDGSIPTLNLARRTRFDIAALRRLARFIRGNNISLLHAHSTSLFTAIAVRPLVPGVRVIWHAHFGKTPPPSHRDWLFAAAAKGASGVLAVSREVENWLEGRIAVPRERISWLPNIVNLPDRVVPLKDLPGLPGSRIVCVANLRPQKDHETLLTALAQVVGDFPQSHLLLVGALQHEDTVASVHRIIRDRRLEPNVTVLGARSDVPAILSACDVGVLSSRHEGLPIALLEYGMTGLPAVATDVGDCGRVLDNGKAGIVCRAGAANEIAAGIIRLLRSSELRHAYGTLLRERTERIHGPEAVLKQIDALYERVLDGLPPSTIAIGKESLV